MLLQFTVQFLGLLSLACVTFSQQVPCPIVIDVRQASAFDSAHVSCAMSIPSNSIDTWLTSNKDTYQPDQPFYIYCYAGVLAGQARDKFVAQEFTNSYNGGGYNQKKEELEEICALRALCTSSPSTSSPAPSAPSAPSAPVANADEEGAVSSTAPSSSTTTKFNTIDKSELPGDLDTSTATTTTIICPLFLSVVLCTLLQV